MNVKKKMRTEIILEASWVPVQEILRPLVIFNYLAGDDSHPAGQGATPYLNTILADETHLYTKMHHRFGYRETNSTFDGDPELYGRLEKYTHLEIFGKLFQYAFTDSFFRRLQTSECVYSRYSTLRDYAWRYKSVFNVENFQTVKSFFRLLFANPETMTSDHTEYISKSDVKTYVFDWPVYLQTIRPCDDENYNIKCYMAMRVSLFYYIAYRANFISDVWEFINKILSSARVEILNFE